VVDGVVATRGESVAAILVTDLSARSSAVTTDEVAAWRGMEQSVDVGGALSVFVLLISLDRARRGACNATSACKWITVIVP
jgi:hypothetical protein